MLIFRFYFALYAQKKKKTISFFIELSENRRLPWRIFFVYLSACEEYGITFRWESSNEKLGKTTKKAKVYDRCHFVLVSQTSLYLRKKKLFCLLLLPLTVLLLLIWFPSSIPWESGKFQHRKVSESIFSPNWKVSESESIRIGRCQNRKSHYLKV